MAQRLIVDMDGVLADIYARHNAGLPENHHIRVHSWEEILKILL